MTIDFNAVAPSDRWLSIAPMTGEAPVPPIAPYQPSTISYQRSAENRTTEDRRTTIVFGAAED